MAAPTGQEEREIVGIIRDLHDRGLAAKPVPTVYVPFRQFAFAYGAVMASTNARPEAILPEIRRHIATATPSVALKNLTTIDTRLSKTLDFPRFYAVIAVACALMAILFVSLGLYGVISYTVASRTSEIGIRMALGAARKEVLWNVLWQGLKLSAIGVALGMGLSVASTRLLRTLLFEVKPIDPVTLGLAAALVVIVTLIASYFPARRASLVDPMIALRCE
jgi:predicted lysophospholipase L1 biosynthesis ABC-type transport system permease subunit